MNAGQRAGLRGTYNFSVPHSSHRSRLRRLKQIATGQIAPDQVHLTSADLIRGVQQTYGNDDFSIRYEDDHAEDSRNDHADDRGAVEPGAADQTSEEAEGISGQ